jgi:hypothetical protein
VLRRVWPAGTALLCAAIAMAIALAPEGPAAPGRSPALLLLLGPSWLGPGSASMP